MTLFEHFWLASASYTCGLRSVMQAGMVRKFAEQTIEQKCSQVGLVYCRVVHILRLLHTQARGPDIAAAST